MKEGYNTRDRQVRTKRYGRFTAMPRENHQADADDGTDRGGQQNHQRQHLPAKPRTDGGEQLEITITHALLTRGEFEQPEHRP